MVIDDQPNPVTLVRLGRLSAELTNDETGLPLAGKEIIFSSGNTELCRAKTDAAGRASCTLALDRALTTILGFRYTADYAGEGWTEASSATGKLARVLGLFELF